MKYLLLTCALLFVFTTTNAQFHPTDNGLTIIVTDGTDKGKNSGTAPKSDIPQSYDHIGKKSPATKNALAFTDPIRSLGMTDCIQAAAFLDRPEYGKKGFLLIFSLNDSIGGRQATLVKNGVTYRGVYRLVREKLSSDEVIPKGMTTYKVEGTFILLGIS